MRNGFFQMSSIINLSLPQSNSHVSVITAERTNCASSPLPAIFDEGLQLDDQRLTT